MSRTDEIIARIVATVCFATILATILVACAPDTIQLPPPLTKPDWP